MEQKMLTLAYKIELIEYCLKQLGNKEAELQQEIDETMKISNDYGAPKDRYDGFKNQQMRKVEMLSAQLHLIQEDTRVYLQIDKSHELTAVRQGALVQTKDQLIFVATSIGKLDFDGKSIFVISPKVPYYEAIKGAKKGSSVKFRDAAVEILDLV
jgi:hypothetical protein